MTNFFTNLNRDTNRLFKKPEQSNFILQFALRIISVLLFGLLLFDSHQSDACTVTGVVTNVSCYGGNNGAITVSVSGGTSPYHWLWNNGVTTQNRTSLTAGTYTVTVTESNGGSGSATFSVTQPTALSVTAVTTNVTSSGGTNGAIDVTVSGGTSPYYYLWNGGATTQDRSGLSAGTYTVTVTDNHSCTAVSTYTITQPTCDAHINSVIIYNLSNGSTFSTITDNSSYVLSSLPSSWNIEALVSGSTVGSIQFIFSGSSTITNIENITPWRCPGDNTQLNLGVGSYTLLIKAFTASNAGGSLCQQLTLHFSITPTCSLGLSATSTNVSCYGGSNGSISVTPSGAQGTVTYLWNNGATTQNRSGLVAGTYTVTASDGGCSSCTATLTRTITQPSSALSVTGVVTNVTTNGGTNGAIDVSVAGGSSPYYYLWNSGATTQDRSSLTAGTYTVTVTDNSNCTSQQTYTITQPVCNAQINSVIVYSLTNATTFDVIQDGDSYTLGSLPTNWNIEALVSGTTAESVQFNFSGSYISSNIENTYPFRSPTDAVALNLGIGSYTLDVKLFSADNASGSMCAEVVLHFSITPSCTVSLSATNTNVSCYGGNNGSIDVSVSGAQGTVTYLWNNGATTQDRSGLAAGTYTVTATDAICSNCTATLTRTITQPSSALTTTASVVNVTITGGTDNGSINVTVSGGTSPYHYLWNNGVTTEDRTALLSGTYTVTVTDNNNCTAQQTYTLTQPPCGLTLSETHNNVSCYGGNNGSITITVSGAQSAVNYLWNDGTTTQNRSGLSAGTYTVTASESCGCIATKTITIEQPSTAVGVSMSKTDVTITNGNNGTATATASGGTPGYTYQWSNGATTSIISNLTAGTYTITVTDSHGCSASNYITLTQPSCTLTLSETHNNVSCYGGNNGSITITVSGAQSAVNYLWNDGTTTQNRSGLSAGTYTVTASESCGCSATKTITIEQPSTAVGVSMSKTDVTITNGNNGTATATASGGTPGYTYQWSNGATTSIISNLTAGTYTITVTDSHGCSASNYITLTQPSCTLTLSETHNNVSCYGGNNGSITITVSGAQSAVNYLWNDGTTTQNRSGLSAGTYTVTASESCGCSATKTITIEQPSTAVGVSMSKTDVTITNGNNGTATATASGGTPGYTYQWSNGATTSIISNLTAGTYTITVTDSHGCSASNYITLTQPSCTLTLSETHTNVSCYGGNNGSITITVSGAQSAVNYLWNDGTTTQNRSGLSAGTYTVTASESCGCIATKTITIEQPSTAVGVSMSKTDVTITNGNNGTATATASGGTPGYTYQWSNGATTSIISNLTAGTYTITVTDSHGCSASNYITLTQPSCTLSLSETHTNVSCYGGTNGSITITPNGAQSAVNYLWNDGTTTQNRSGLSAGTYTVTASESCGCSATKTITIEQPSTAVGVSMSKTDVTITNGNNGTATATASGGTPGYTYQWSNGATTSIISNLTAGTYTITVTDSHGCSASNYITLTQPSCTLTLSETHTNVSCYGGNNGSITITVSGAQSAVNYLWNDGTTTQNRSGLTAGTYTVTATESCGCSATKTITISQPSSSVSVSMSKTDVTITNGNNGTATATPSGGTPGYTYLWSNNSTTAIITGLTAGTYGVTVTDSHGCSASNYIVVNQPTCTLSLSETHTNVSCYGGTNGSITITVSGAQSAVNYLWNDGTTTQNRSGLSAGTYTVTASESCGCIATKTITIEQPSTAMGVSMSKTDVTITNGNNGTATATASGGTPGYTYQWSNGATTSIISNLTAGTYTITVTDSHGCSASNYITLTQPSCTLTLSETHNNVSCYGGNNGSITITPSGAQSAVNYLWNDGTTTQNRSGLTAGTYTVTATESCGCSATKTITISQPSSSVSVSMSKTDVTITNGNNGTATATPSGGTPGYTYLWSNNSTTATITGLTAGTYGVTVTDSHGCSASNYIVVNQPTCTLSLSETHTNVSCYGGNNGSITITVSGAQSAVNYLWNDGTTTQNRSGLSAGTYTVTASESCGCIATKTITIEQPSTAMGVSMSKTDVTITNGNNGTATATASGGTPGYTYQWSNGATTSIISNLTAGTYTITVTDSHGCSASNYITLTQPSCTLTLSETHNNVSCYGGNNGSITITPSGAQSAVNYLWNDGTTTQNRSGLTAGTYTVTATESCGCSATKTITISQPSSSVSVSMSKTDVTITNGNNGTATATPSGGTPGYTYLWSNNSTTATITGLTAGTYGVTVTDSHGCSASNYIVVNQPTCTLSLSETHTNVSCYGGNNGSITITVSGAQSAVNYLWNDGTTTQNRSGLSAGTYTVTASESCGCIATKTITIEQPSTAVGVSMSKTDVTITNGNNGTATATASGGTPGYTYQWSNGATTSIISNLTAGTYTITVTDSHGCSASNYITVNQPPCSLSLSFTCIKPSCHGDANGSIDIIVTGAQGNISYLWNDGTTTEDRTGLVAATYTVTATDAGGCTATFTQPVGEPAALEISATQINVSITGGSNGSIDVTVTGGSGAHTYLWNDGATIEDRTGLTAGTYTVTVTDAHACTAQQSYTITQPSCALAISETHSNISCYGANNGSITITASGAQGTVTYLWNNGATTQNRSVLAAGTCTVTATDGGGCTAVKTVTISQPSSALSVSMSKTNVTITNGNNGIVTATPGGGTPGYTYLWSNGGTTSTISGLVAATYTVTVTDSHGCTASNSISVTQPACSLSLTKTSTNVSCFGGNNGSINITPSGAQGMVTYLWNGGATTQNRTGLAAGTYTVTATDVGGCTASKTVTLNQPATVVNVSMAKTDVTTVGGNNGTATATASGGSPGYTYLWSNGRTTSSITGLSAGTFTVMVTDTKGCTATNNTTVNQPSCTLNISEGHTDVSCYGGSNGSITITASGAQGTVTYLWNGGATTQNRSALSSGTYTVTATDGGGCTASKTVTISQPQSAVAASMSKTDVTITNGNNGTATATASGGMPGYSYQWSNGGTTSIISGLTSGTYTVTVTDSHGCSATNNINLTQPPCALTLSETHTDVSCNGGNNGSISISPSGAQSFITYLWNNGVTTQNRTGLTAGTYIVTATESCGCTATKTVTISQPASAIGMVMSKTDVTISGGNNGTATATASGGTPSYTYQWSNGRTTSAISGLIAGTYTVTVTDSHGCSASNNITLVQPTCVCAPPTTFTLDSLSSTQANLCWNAIPCATGYIIKWRTEPKLAWLYRTIIAPTACTIFTNQYPDVYDIQVATVCSTGDTSTYSSMYVYHTYPSCLPPGGLYTNSITSTKATAHWNTVPDAGSYTVAYRVVGTTSFTTKSASSTSLVLKNLLAGMSYEWKVASNCGSGTSVVTGQYSALTTFVTPAVRVSLTQDNYADATFTVYPNPSSGNFNIDFDLGAESNDEYLLIISNTLGQVVYSEKNKLNGGHLNEKLLVPETFASGLYAVSVVINGHQFKQTMIISK